MDNVKPDTNVKVEELLDLVRRLIDGTRKSMKKCQTRRFQYEKVLSDELDEKIDREALNSVKVDHHLILLKIFNFFNEKKKNLFEFMFQFKDELFSNDGGILHVINVFQDYKVYLEKGTVT